MTTPKQGKKKAAGSLILALILAAMLVVTSVALLFSMVSVDGNTFQMGRVKIELNDGQTIFNETSLVVEPGYSVVEDFTVENTGTADAYYRLYLENVSGSLKDILVFDLYDGDQLIFSGKASELTRQNPCSGDTVLTVGETRTLTAVVKMPEETSNAVQNGSIAFDLTVDAVQAKNNPDRLFN